MLRCLRLPLTPLGLTAESALSRKRERGRACPGSGGAAVRDPYSVTMRSDLRHRRSIAKTGSMGPGLRFAAPGHADNPPPMVRNAMLPPSRVQTRGILPVGVLRTRRACARRVLHSHPRRDARSSGRFRHPQGGSEKREEMVPRHSGCPLPRARCSSPSGAHPVGTLFRGTHCGVQPEGLGRQEAANPSADVDTRPSTRPGPRTRSFRKHKGRYPLILPATAPSSTIRTVRTAPPKRKVLWR